MAKHDDRSVRPLALELLAFVSGVLRCDRPGCDRIATWRSAGELARFRCVEHKAVETDVQVVTLHRDTEPRHGEPGG